MNETDLCQDDLDVLRRRAKDHRGNHTVFMRDACPIDCDDLVALIDEVERRRDEELSRSEAGE